MIIRISGDGRDQIDGTVPAQLNVLDDAIPARDRERLSRLLAVVRDAGERLGAARQPAAQRR